MKMQIFQARRERDRKAQRAGISRSDAGREQAGGSARAQHSARPRRLRSVPAGRSGCARTLQARRGELKWLVGVAFLVLLLCDPAGAIAAARDAMGIWAESVAPSLFPFMAVLPLLTGVEARRLYARVLARPMRALFALPGHAAAAVTVGLLSGSPTGAIACAHIADGMQPDEFRRMALMCCGMSPVYLISGIGVSLMHGRQAGFLLAAAQLTAQLATGLILRWIPQDRTDPAGTAAQSATIRQADTAGAAAAPILTYGAKTESAPAQEGSAGQAELAEKWRAPAQNAAVPGHLGRRKRAENPIRTAAVNLLQVAGYMALFAVIADFAGSLLGERTGKIARMALDLPGGAVVAAGLEIGYMPKMALLGAMSGFGGVCIAAQNMAVLGLLGVRWKEYLSVKCGQGLIAAGVCAAGARFLPAAQESVGAFAISGPGALEMSSLGMAILLVPVICALLPVRRRRT